MQRKIFKTGNNLVVSLPKEVLDQLGLTDGNEVSVELNRKKSEIVIRPTRSPLAAEIDEKFAQQVNDFIEEYRPALEALAKK
jgi:putative addiction module antidote